MRARHRISKLLLRHDLLWEGSTWTIAHERWLAEQRFAARGLRIAYEESLAAMYAVQARRVALDAAIAEEAAQEPWAGIVGRLCCLRGVSVLTAFGLAVEIGDWQRFDGRSIGAYLGLVPRESSSGERRSLGPSPRPATVTHGAFWSRPPGITAGRCAKAASWPVGVRASHPWYASAPKRRDGACTAAGLPSMPAANVPQWQPWPSLASWQAGVGAWRRWPTERPPPKGRRPGERDGPKREEHARSNYEQPFRPRSMLDKRRSRRPDGHADTQTRAYQADRASPPSPLRSPERLWSLSRSLQLIGEDQARPLDRSRSISVGLERQVGQAPPAGQHAPLGRAAIGLGPGTGGHAALGLSPVDDHAHVAALGVARFETVGEELLERLGHDDRLHLGARLLVCHLVPPRRLGGRARSSR
jgi:hypothetical protein